MRIKNNKKSLNLIKLDSNNPSVLSEELERDESSTNFISLH